MSSYKFEEVCNFCYKLSSHKTSPTITFRNKASGGEWLLEIAVSRRGNCWVRLSLVHRIQGQSVTPCNAPYFHSALGFIFSM